MQSVRSLGYALCFAVWNYLYHGKIWCICSDESFKEECCFFAVLLDICLLPQLLNFNIAQEIWQDRTPNCNMCRLPTLFRNCYPVSLLYIIQDAQQAAGTGDRCCHLYADLRLYALRWKAPHCRCVNYDPRGNNRVTKRRIGLTVQNSGTLCEHQVSL